MSLTRRTLVERSSEIAAGAITGCWACAVLFGEDRGVKTIVPAVAPVWKPRFVLVPNFAMLSPDEIVTVACRGGPVRNWTLASVFDAIHAGLKRHGQRARAGNLRRKRSPVE